MTKQHIHISLEDANRGFERFIEAWHESATGAKDRPEIHLNFEDLLTAALTRKRLELMRTLRQHGPLSVRALSKQLAREYKNVHADARILEEVELIQRTEEGLLVAPWDVIDAHVRLVA